MEEYQKISNLKTSFIKLCADGVLTFQDKDLSIEKLLGKLYRKEEEVQNNFISAKLEKLGLSKKK